MLRKGYVFLLVVFLCKTLTGIPCNSGGNASAGESEQILPTVGIFSFSFPSFPLFPSMQRWICGGAASPKPPCVPASCKRYPRCCPVQGLPTGLGTTGSVGHPPPYLLRETARGLTHGGWCPLAAGHTAPGRGRGTGSWLRCWKCCSLLGLLPWRLRVSTES